MKLCRYDDDRLGVVRGNMVHDVTDAQTQIRAAAPYAMQGDAVIAALPAWRSRLEDMASKAPGKPISSVKLLSPVARPSKLVAAPTNYKAHVEEMAARVEQGVAQPGPFSPFIEKAGLFLKANSSMVGPSEGVEIRFPDRRNEHEVELCIVFSKQGSDIPRDKTLDYVAGYCIGLDMTARGQEDRSFRKSIDSYSVLGPWLVTADEIPDPDNVPLRDLRQRREEAGEPHQHVDLRLQEADRMGLDFLHMVSGRRAVYRDAGRREPGEARRHHARSDRPDRRDERRGQGTPGGMTQSTSAPNRRRRAYSPRGKRPIPICTGGTPCSARAASRS